MGDEVKDPDSAKSTGFRALDRLLNVIGAVAAVAASVWGIVVKLQVDEQNQAIGAINAEISKSADERENRKLDLDMTMKVFEEVKDIYKTPGLSPEVTVNRLSAVSAVVLAVPDQAVRERLSQAVGAALEMQTSGSDARAAKQAQSVKTSLDVGIFDAATSDDGVVAQAVKVEQVKKWAEQSSTNKPRWGSLAYNLFWCEDAANPGAAMQAANQAQALRKLDPNGTGEWRVRKLPRGVNERSGYQIHRNLIRTSSDDETAIGKILVSVLAQHGLPGFTIEQISYPSPASISLFFCGGEVP